MNQIIGQTLGGHYQITSHLGGGGFGQTYLAKDQYLPGNPQCVVKQLQPQATDPFTLQTARRLFDTEAKILYQLGTHDQIPRLFAYFEENQEFYLVQEFIEGHDLSQELTPAIIGGQLSEGDVIGLLQDILEILEFVHQQNVIHRDVKPRNILRRQKDGKLVLIDFGAVKQVSTQIINGAQASFTVAIGTPGYQPSEQASGNPRLSSDIYAVGMIGLQALTGLSPNQIPIDGDTGEIIWHDKAKVSPELANVLDKMVRYDFRQRYQSGKEALQAVKNLKFSTKPTSVVPFTKSLPTSNNQNKPTKYKVTQRQVLSWTMLIALGVAVAVFMANLTTSSNATQLYNQAKNLYDLNRYEEALTAYKKAVGVRPEYLDAWNGQGKTLLSLKRYKEALEAYEKAIQLKPDDLDAWVGRGYALDSLERYEEAISSFDKALKIQITSAEAWNGQGDALMNLQRYEQAIASYDKAVELKPDYYQSWYNRGWALHSLKRYQEAIKSYDKVVQFKPEYYQAWYNRGNGFINLQRYQEAVESYDKAVQYKPEYYQAWYSRGNALNNLRQYKDAIASFDKAVSYQPDLYEAWHVRGWVLHQSQRYEDAVESYDKALQLKTKDYLVWYNRGNALYNLKRYQEAVNSYDRAVKIKPDNYESWYSRGNGLLNLKREKDAIASYDKALQYKRDYQQAIEAKKRVEAAQLQQQPQQPNINLKIN